MRRFIAAFGALAVLWLAGAPAVSAQTVTPGGASPGGSSGQLQYNASGSFGGAALGGDCSFSAPNITCTKTNGVAFAASATTNATNAANISSGTLPAARLPTPNVVVCPSTAPTKPSSSAWTMAGLGGSCAITPSQSGDVVAACTGSFSMSSATVAADGIAVQIAEGTGTAPANGAAATGTVLGAADFDQSATSGASLSTLSVQSVATGLTKGTTYWFDLQAQQEGSNAHGSFFPISCTLHEVP